MILCTNCESDLVVKKDFYAFKIPIVLIIFIVMPYGLYYCWLPFLFRGNYACKKCGHEASKFKEIDWREFEKLRKEKVDNFDT